MRDNDSGEPSFIGIEVGDQGTPGSRTAHAAATAADLRRISSRAEYYQTRAREDALPVNPKCDKCGSTENVYLITAELHGDWPSLFNKHHENWVKPIRIGKRCTKCAAPMIEALKKAVRENK